MPQSQRGHTNQWASHHGRAAKALTKLTKPHLPASLTQLHKAIDRAHQDVVAVPQTDFADTSEPAGPASDAGVEITDTDTDAENEDLGD